MIPYDRRVTRLIEEGVQHDDHLKRMYVHVIDAEAEMQDFGVSSKLNAHWQFLQHLRRGRLVQRRPLALGPLAVIVEFRGRA